MTWSVTERLAARRECIRQGHNESYHQTNFLREQMLSGYLQSGHALLLAGYRREWANDFAISGRQRVFPDYVAERSESRIWISERALRWCRRAHRANSKELIDAWHVECAWASRLRKDSDGDTQRLAELWYRHAMTNPTVAFRDFATRYASNPVLVKNGHFPPTAKPSAFKVEPWEAVMYAPLGAMPAVRPDFFGSAQAILDQLLATSPASERVFALIDNTIIAERAVGEQTARQIDTFLRYGVTLSVSSLHLAVKSGLNAGQVSAAEMLFLRWLTVFGSPDSDVVLAFTKWLVHFPPPAIEPVADQLREQRRRDFRYHVHTILPSMPADYTNLFVEVGTGGYEAPTETDGQIFAAWVKAIESGEIEPPPTYDERRERANRLQRLRLLDDDQNEIPPPSARQIIQQLCSEYAMHLIWLLARNRARIIGKNA